MEETKIDEVSQSQASTNQKQVEIKNLQNQAEKLFPMPANPSAQEATRISDQRRAWIIKMRKELMKKGKIGKYGASVVSKLRPSKAIKPIKIGDELEENATFAFNGIVF